MKLYVEDRGTLRVGKWVRCIAKLQQNATNTGTCTHRKRFKTYIGSRATAWDERGGGGGGVEL